MTGEEFLKQPSQLKVMANGLFGSGKTTFGMSFPKVYYIGTEPGGLEILRAPDGKHLVKNLAYYQECYLDPLAGKDDIKKLVEEVDATTTCRNWKVEEGEIYKSIKDAYGKFKEGKVETLFLDNLTYTSELFWDYLDRYLKPDFTTDKGKVDRLKMYGELSRWLWRFMSRVVSFPGNVVVSCHLKSESKEKMEAKKLNTDVNVAPNILGGFRDEAEGFFTASLYLERKSTIVTDQAGNRRQKAEYRCYTQPQIALGSKILAKNRHGLPPVIESVTYDKIMQYINGAVEAKA